MQRSARAWHFERVLVVQQNPAAVLVERLASQRQQTRAQSQQPDATILAVSLDEQPLASISRAILQIGTVMRPTGWQQTPGTFKDGDKPFESYQVVSTGQLLYRAANTSATITSRNPNFKSATLLDANGYRAGKIEVTRVGAELKIELPPNALWVVVE